MSKLAKTLGGIPLEEISPKRFVYDNKEKCFIVGSTMVSAAEYHPVLYEDGSNYDSAAMLSTTVGFIGTPILYEFIKSLQQVAAIKQDVVNVMVNVYEQVLGENIGKINRKPDSLFGFNIELLRPGHPRLNVLGNCACFGVEPEPWLLEEEDTEKGYMMFGEHNIDANVQRISLYAGIGYVAKLAEQA